MILTNTDIVTFGSPCQDLSVAGKRKGLGGERSWLFHEAIRVLRELRPAVGVWENVPGAFSSDAGHDFHAVLSAFQECGARDIAWRVLDSRYFDVAQRRERVFVVADFRGERAGEILFESPCGCGDFATGAEAGTRTAPSVTPGARRASGNRGSEQLAVTHTLCASGFDASEDGTGRGTPLGAFMPNRTLEKDGSVAEGFAQRDVTDALHGPTGNKEPLVVTADRISGNGDVMEQGDRTAALTWASDPNQNIIAAADALRPQIFQTRIARNGRGQPKDVADNLTSCEGGTHAYSKPHVFGGGMSVRRLTPTETLRLQSFPDSWLDLDPPLSDSSKYRMVGNAVTVNVAEWIARRIKRACPELSAFGELFAGIGGFGLGFERAGVRCQWQVEKDPACLRVLAHHWPDVPRGDDVRVARGAA